MLEQLTPGLILGIIAVYFLVLLGVSYFTSQSAGNDSFFIGERKSPWIVVAIGMIGASLSGVTFISIPGWVKDQSFAYMQMVFGYLVGYLIIATILMPLYYRMRLTSIYTYLEDRFGTASYKIGAAYFLLSRTIGAAFRLFLVAIVLHKFVLEPMGVSFALTVMFTIILIWIYTFRGGIKTIIWTDMIQTISMLTAVVLTIYAIAHSLEISISDVPGMIRNSNYSQMFFFEGGWSDGKNFFKQFISGALIAIVMTGLDQDMMQKNLSCKNIGSAQKNMLVFSVILVFANILFLALGALLYIYAANIGLAIPEKTDLLYPSIALTALPPFVGIVFVIGLIAAAYSSADSALTALTTSFCIDFLNFEKSDQEEAQKKRSRVIVHISFSVLLFFIILIFKQMNNEAVVAGLFKAAGYTYGPILGLFAFGMLTPMKIRKGYWVYVVCLLAPILSYIINVNSADWLFGFEFGFLIIALNGLLTFLGLLAISYRDLTPSEQ